MSEALLVDVKGNDGKITKVKHIIEHWGIYYSWDKRNMVPFARSTACMFRHGKDRMKPRSPSN